MRDIKWIMLKVTQPMSQVSTSSKIDSLSFKTVNTVTSKPFIDLFPEDMTAVVGKRVVLPVKVFGSPQPTLTWYHDNTPLNNDYAHEIGSDGSLTIITAEMRHKGVYQLVARNSLGSVEEQFSLKVVTKVAEGQPAVVMTWNKPVPVAEFGQYVAQNHGNTNKGFNILYNVSDAQLVCFIEYLSYLLPVP